MRVGIVDTMFSRVNTFPVVTQAFNDVNWAPEILRSTVPGIKDIAVECQILFDKGADIVIALGMVGPENADKQCAHEASTAIQQVMLKHNKHILEVFVHMDEALDDADLAKLAENRAYKHAINAYWLMEKPGELQKRAGTGERQGRTNAGPVEAWK